jgi:hypothetical protein
MKRSYWSTKHMLLGNNAQWEDAGNGGHSETITQAANCGGNLERQNSFRLLREGRNYIYNLFKY